MDAHAGRALPSPRKSVVDVIQAVGSCGAARQDFRAYIILPVAVPRAALRSARWTTTSFQVVVLKGPCARTTSAGRGGQLERWIAIRQPGEHRRQVSPEVKKQDDPLAAVRPMRDEAGAGSRGPAQTATQDPGSADSLPSRIEPSRARPIVKKVEPSSLY